MPKITEIRDAKSAAVPSIEEMRASQKAGGEGKGLPENANVLNEAQGHDVDIRE